MPNNEPTPDKFTKKKSKLRLSPRAKNVTSEQSGKTFAIIGVPPSAKLKETSPAKKPTKPPGGAGGVAPTAEGGAAAAPSAAAIANAARAPSPAVDLFDKVLGTEGIPTIEQLDNLKKEMVSWAVYSSNDGFPPKLVAESEDKKRPAEMAKENRFGPEAYENDLSFVENVDVMKRYSPDYVAEFEEWTKTLKALLEEGENTPKRERL
jgi:hypothetical protein